MADSVAYASFMIRMWRDPVVAPDGETGGEEVAWVGEVESVQSGQVLPFRGLEALAELLVGRLIGATDFLE